MTGRIRKTNTMRQSALVFLMIAVSALYSCGSSSSNTSMASVSSANAKIVACPAAANASVSITTSPAFAPGSTPISVNSVVQWTNNDTIVHTVTSGISGAPDGAFDSGNLAPNATVCVQFLSAGTYHYFCNIHTFLTGTGTVQ